MRDAEEVPNKASQGRAQNTANWRDCPGALFAKEPVTRSLEACVASSGVNAVDHIRLHLGDLPPQLQTTGSISLKFDPLTVFVTDQPINIEWDEGPYKFLFNDVGGTGESILQLDLGIDDNRLTNINFAWQNRPLKLEEAVGRARQFQEWLLSHGFQVNPSTANPTELPFAVLTDDFRIADVRPADWTSARDLLAKEAEDVAKMHLYTLVSPTGEVSVTIRNARRQAWQFAKSAGAFHDLGPDQRQSIFDGNGGYEWFLEINIARPDDRPQSSSSS